MATKLLKKLGKIVSVAAPIIAAPFTGGTSLALIGAGAGALGGLASGGGLKGALLGAGMGAIPVPGAAGSAKALNLTTGEAIKRGLLNPQALTRIGGAALDGRAGTLASLASGFLPGAGIYNAKWQGAPYNGSVMGMESAPLFGPGAVNTGAWTGDVGAAPTGGKMGFSLGNLFKGFTGRDKATLAVGGLNAILGYRGTGQQIDANDRALEYQRRSDAEMRALLAAQREEDYQRELIREAALQKRFDAEQLGLQTRWDAQEKRLADQYNAREARMSPYRESGRTSLARIANIQAPTITPYTPSLVYRS